MPAAGLGNQLFVIMKASLFAHVNNVPVVFTNYKQFNIGPYLRREKSKRLYTHSFVFHTGLMKDYYNRLRMKVLFFKYREVVQDPGVDFKKISDAIYQFRSLPHWGDYFAGLKEHRDDVIRLFNQLLTNRVKAAILHLSCPVIGLHVRMGDFRKLAKGEDFSQVGAVRTPIQYFIDVIQNIRNINGSLLPVSVFSDGHEFELKDILALPNITLIKNNSDIVDMVLLSKSKIIITSAGSTYSYWAGFLSEVPIILHPDHIHQPIRLYKTESFLYEGILDEGNASLTNYIESIS